MTPKEIFVHRTPQLGLLSGSEINVTGSDVKYRRSDLVVDKDDLVKFIDEKINNLSDLLAAQDDPVHSGQRAAFQVVKDYLESKKIDILPRLKRGGFSGG